ncbi:MAG: RIP metalloprotease RseP [Firmicutes bacterium]|jgi:regulator of sigma E protease|nr:RIP metalloprotease RseP [Bacillota bacterium]
MPILIAVLVFSAVIIVHELGHFLAARAAGIAVEEFSIGFGPKLVSLGRDTKFSLRLIPMGGYVRMLGEEDGSGGDNPASYPNATPLKRMAVIGAGPIMNFVLAMIIFVILFASVGATAENVARIGGTIPGSPAEQAGLMPGDEILSIDGEVTEKWTDIQEIVRASNLKPLTFTLRRGEQTLVIEITPRMGESAPEVGISPPMKRLSLGASIVQGIKETWRMTATVVSSFVGIITRKIPVGELTGPIGIVHYVGEAARTGFLNVLSLTALISVNLGIFNLLPVPALDGSKIVFLGLELIRKKPLDPEKEGLVHLVGFAALIVLMLLVMYKDIVRFLL